MLYFNTNLVATLSTMPPLINRQLTGVALTSSDGVRATARARLGSMNRVFRRILAQKE